MSIRVEHVHKAVSTELPGSVSVETDPPIMRVSWGVAPGGAPLYPAEVLRLAEVLEEMARTLRAEVGHA